jgi:hypothetical protein
MSPTTDISFDGRAAVAAVSARCRSCDVIDGAVAYLRSVESGGPEAACGGGSDAITIATGALCI